MKKSFLLLTISAICFLSNPSYPQSPKWTWAKSAGGSGDDASFSVAVDRSGNSYVTGAFSATITFGSYTLTTPNPDGMFVVKYDADGNVVWAKSAGGTADAYGVFLTVDHNGNAYIVGTSKSGYLIFGTDTIWNGYQYNVFVAKYDAGGNALWARSVGGTYPLGMTSIAVDSSGNSYVTGMFSSSTLTFGSYILTNAGTMYIGSFDLFLVKYDANGNVVWAKSEGGIYDEMGNSVTLDNTGGPCVTGFYTSYTIIVGSDTLKNGGNTLLIRYDADGNVLWAKSGAAPERIYDVEGVAVAGDVSGNIYMTGVFQSTSITFDSITLTNAFNDHHYDIFLVKYDASGNVLWAKSAGGILSEYGTSLALDVSGNPYITGYYSSPNLIFGIDTLTNLGIYNIFLAKYDTNGNVLWAKGAGGTADDYSNSVAVDHSGCIYIAGTLGSSNLIFGSDTLTKSGQYDMFLATVNSSSGFPELKNSPGIMVFPNPATDKITIKIAEGQALSQLSILNLNGEEVLTRSLIKPKTQIDISNLPSGIYFVRLTNKSNVATGKFVKQ
ncbi:MAG: T9SS type A sorting domain-containing protein [Bacteroidetes bacterium]|nr:T9SS type A sorting domain-containing protein [Bacteroidota bacterium]